MKRREFIAGLLARRRHRLLRGASRRPFPSLRYCQAEPTNFPRSPMRLPRVVIATVAMSASSSIL